MVKLGGQWISVLWGSQALLRILESPPASIGSCLSKSPRAAPLRPSHPTLASYLGRGSDSLFFLVGMRSRG